MRDTAASIRKAFAGVLLPKTARDIAPHDCPECNELAAALLGRHYHEIPSKVVDGLFEALPLLSPPALCHYLPAWLLRALENPSGDVMEFSIYALAPSEKRVTDGGDYFQRRIAAFNDEQRAAIYSFFLDVEEYQLWTGYEGEIERGKKLWGAS